MRQDFRLNSTTKLQICVIMLLPVCPLLRLPCRLCVATVCKIKAIRDGKPKLKRKAYEKELRKLQAEFWG